MIFGLDHVTLGGPLTNARKAFLLGLGYQPSLSMENLVNLELKRPWLHEYGPAHGLALYRVPAGVGIEVIDHYKTQGAADRLLPVLHGDAPLFASDTLSENTLRGPAWWSPTLGAGYVLEPGPPQPVNAFVWRTSQSEETARFWGRLGFTPDGGDASDLRFRGIDGVGCSLTLVSAVNSQPTRLDSEGFTCFAFVSTSVGRDLEELRDQGAAVSPVGSITPGERPLDVGFAEGPDGVVVELIGSKR